MRWDVDTVAGSELGWSHVIEEDKRSHSPAPCDRQQPADGQSCDVATAGFDSVWRVHETHNGRARCFITRSLPLPVLLRHRWRFELDHYRSWELRVVLQAGEFILKVRFDRLDLPVFIGYP